MNSPDPMPAYIYYDGWCSACVKSAKLFTKLDKGRGLVVCIDFRSDDSRVKLAGVPADQLATSIHTRTPDATLHSGPEALRQAFTILGHRHSASWTALPIIRPLVDACYRAFARNRLRWFGKHACMEGTCAVNPNTPSHHDET
tara:strand:- start:29530 stop:29958 length:429 start_codon:yes stop_codon:yes gene_type:complete